MKGVKPIAFFSKMECYGCNWRWVHKYDKYKVEPCINNIRMDYLIIAVEQILPKIKVNPV